MRIIAGEFKRRKLNTLAGMNTRPTTDRNKENIYNIIGPYFTGGKCLDMFGGSGGLTLEAVSRGIEKAIIIDNNSEAIKIIKENSNTLKVNDRVEVIKGDYLKVMESLAKTKVQFDLILIDPPFKMLVIDQIIKFIDQFEMLAEEGIIVAEFYKDNVFEAEFEKIYCYRFLDYGSSQIKLYRLKEND